MPDLFAMQPRIILNSKQFELTVNRLCYELIENHNDFSNTALIGLQTDGVYLMSRIVQRLRQILPAVQLEAGELDVTFFRDDFRRRESPLTAEKTRIDFLVENKRVVLIDDVLFTGRTIRAGMDALISFGRPADIELLVLIDRRFSRHVPIQPNYTGKTVDSIASERVTVEWAETHQADKVVLHSTDQAV